LKTEFVCFLWDDGLKFHPMRLTSTRSTISTNKSEPTLNRLNPTTLIGETRLRELPHTQSVSLSLGTSEKKTY
jgi:hypothetical protein